MIYVLLALQLLDGWSTWQIYRFRRGEEANPVMRAVIASLGLFWGLVAGKGWAVIVVLVAQQYGLWDGDSGKLVLALITAVYLFIVGRNLWILYK